MKLANVKQPKAPLLLRVVALYVALYGLLIWLPDHRAQLSIAAQIETSVATPVMVAPTLEIKQIIAGQPTRLVIDRLNIDLDIKDGSYSPADQTWLLNDNSLFFATNTKLPNDQTGLSLFYGHNTVQILANTASLKMGDEVLLEIATGHTLRYRYFDDKLVSPDDDSVFDEKTEQPTLVLLTCSGIFDEHRRLMYFEFVEASDAK